LGKARAISGAVRQPPELQHMKHGKRLCIATMAQQPHPTHLTLFAHNRLVSDTEQSK
jgi:hypothetical protein